MFKENILLALSAIRANKMRSILTMLGIIIGISSVISIVSIGDSMRALFAKEYENIGLTSAYSYVSFYVEDFRSSDYYTLDDLERIKAVFGNEISYISCNASESNEAVHGRNKLKTSYSGADTGYEQINNLQIVNGRLLNTKDILDRKYVAVIEDQTALKLFASTNVIGKSFRTTLHGNPAELTVIGVYHREKSNFMKLMESLDGGEPTGKAIVPYTLLAYPNDSFFMVEVTAISGTDMTDFGERFKQYTAKLKGRQPEDIIFSSAADEMNMLDGIMGGLATAVGAIAAISLLVGGIGIMNIMLVSVTERTREIGIRKALGAKTRDILAQFLIESAIISALGGIIGVIFGFGIVALGGMIAGIATYVRPTVILLAVGFSALVGVFFGLYPARKAAQADPIVALRYE
ncbi:MAG: ABC transporter permease [Clostridia bacterium]|nr:ABC transporter permease [Clostridia bacterium]